MGQESAGEQLPVCAICGSPYTGFGNNAEPLAEGRCCDHCNAYVIVARIIHDWAANHKKEIQGFLDDFEE